MVIKNVNKCSISLYFAAFFMAVYAAKITPFSPVYIAYIALSCFWIPLIFVVFLRRLTLDSLIILVLFFYITVLNFNKIFTGEYINFFVGSMAYIFIRLYKDEFAGKPIVNAIKIIKYTVIVLFTADSVYRILNPTAPTEESFLYIKDSESLWFYIYKFGSLMFADSNTTGLISMIVLFLSVFTDPRRYKSVFSPDNLFLLALIFFSLSRSAIISTILSFFYLYFVKDNRNKIFSYVVFILLAMVSVRFFLLLSSDGSFMSKFYILELIFGYVSEVNFDKLLFGIGVGNSIKYFQIHTHLLFLTYLVEVGLIGLLLFLSFLFVYVIKFGQHMIVPIAIASMSYFLYLGAPFLFVPLALYANYTDINKRLRN